jgi:hypothetical protein
MPMHGCCQLPHDAQPLQELAAQADDAHLRETIGDPEAALSEGAQVH